MLKLILNIMYKYKKQVGFTIVELLVVIVIIGILAAITIVSYTGISSKATASALQSDLDNASRQLKLFQVDNMAYPTTISTNCTTSPTTTTAPTNLCLKVSSGNSYGSSYSANNSSNPQTFTLTATNGSISYVITNDTKPTLVAASTFSATGGTITYTDSNGLNPRSSPAYPGGYTVHTYTARGTFNASQLGNVEVLIVGGGGGGGTWCGGGGGGGGVYTGTVAVTGGSKTVVVGAGAPRATANGAGVNGGLSSFGDYTPAGFYNLVPTMSTNTTPSGEAASSSEFSSNYTSFYAFDHQAGMSGVWNSWVSQNGTPNGWLSYHFASAQVVSAYSIRARYSTDGASNAPNAWTLEGSNNGSTWSALDAKSGQTFSIGQERTFTFANSTAYTYYRINITANNGAAYVGIDELQLGTYSDEIGYGVVGGGGGAGYSTTPGNGGSGGGGYGGGGGGGRRAAGTGISNQGNNGGTGTGNSAGGGGGASSVGINAGPLDGGNTGGPGGNGVQSSISGVATYYGGGGGGWTEDYTTTGSLGGLGGGGNSSSGDGGGGVQAADGAIGTGGGGGGGWYQPYGYNGGAGGSGVVIIRYLTP